MSDKLVCKSCGNINWFRYENGTPYCNCCHSAAYDETPAKKHVDCNCGLANMQDKGLEHYKWCCSKGK